MSLVAPTATRAMVSGCYSLDHPRYPLEDVHPEGSGWVMRALLEMPMEILTKKKSQQGDG